VLPTRRLEPSARRLDVSTRRLVLLGRRLDRSAPPAGQRRVASAERTARLAWQSLRNDEPPCSRVGGRHREGRVSATIGAARAASRESGASLAVSTPWLCVCGLFVQHTGVIGLRHGAIAAPAGPFTTAPEVLTACAGRIAPRAEVARSHDQVLARRPNLAAAAREVVAGRVNVVVGTGKTVAARTALFAHGASDTCRAVEILCPAATHPAPPVTPSGARSRGLATGAGAAATVP
jgi:hypothetical protein